MNSELERAIFVERLARRGHPASLALRIACTPRLRRTQPIETNRRPGLEIAESIERATPIVAKALLYGTLAGRWLREAVSP